MPSKDPIGLKVSTQRTRAKLAGVVNTLTKADWLTILGRVEQYMKERKPAHRPRRDEGAQE